MSRNRYSPRQQEFYRKYMRSPQWRERSRARIVKAGGRCEFVCHKRVAGEIAAHRCHRTRTLECHHVSYDRLGNELDNDLIVLCWVHHILEHLLWKTCVLCRGPVLQNDAYAEHWLLVALNASGIDPDNPGGFGHRPNKEEFLQQLPSACALCRPPRPDD